ncbi:hypothetical protein [Streptomyces sp. NBC_00316]|uniref:hypothetical protein n=1 Tax=Streptomyces sp. NBC_00316 TaxID=2975710 RepID=UPI002E27DE89|nr:hypothetical protein [Streptomyces sp. NBC_00316]
MPETNRRLPGRWVQPQVRAGDQDPFYEDQPVQAARTCGPKAFTVASLVQSALALS